LISIRLLQKSFRSGTETLVVFSGIDLDIYKGEMLAIVGASGVGKSTFLHIVGGLERPTAGSVTFGNMDVYALAPDQIARFRNERVGFIFQFHHLLPEFTAIENVMMPCLIRSMDRDRASSIAQSLLREVGLESRLHHRPGELSGGEQQRVAVARSLVLSPDVVLADEPTGNLDSHTGEAVHDLLKHLNREKGTTFIIVTHNDKLALRANRVFKMSDGTLTQQA
jgi:lipoprotein-releasing system ATP-binding protein